MSVQKPKPTIGCLALQGAVDLHRPHIEACGAVFRAVKTPADFDAVDGFILPGGESTTMLRLIDVFGLWESLQSNFAHKPVWGICAGTILIAQNVLVNDNLSSRDQKSDQKDTQKSFNLLPISVLRNGYGTQLESRHTEISGYTVSFIRAPVIQAVSVQDNKTENSEIEVLAEYDGAPVWVQGKGTQAKYMASTFHPELTQVYPSPMHQKFVDLVSSAAQ